MMAERLLSGVSQYRLTLDRFRYEAMSQECRKRQFLRTEGRIRKSDRVGSLCSRLHAIRGLGHSNLWTY